MKSNNKFKVGELAICIKNDNTNDLLITVGKEYRILNIYEDEKNSSILIMTDVNVDCYIIIKTFFISKRIERKNKLKEISETF